MPVEHSCGPNRFGGDLVRACSPTVAESYHGPNKLHKFSVGLRIVVRWP
jgi:hypothetical protein